MPTLYVDFLFLALLAVILLINPPKSEDSAMPPGTMSVAIAWPEGDSDVDLWIQGPNNGRPVGYSHRSGRLFNLLRDDLGNAGDAMPLNYENAYSRGLPAGEYIINLHCFDCETTMPVSVEVRAGKYGARQKLLFGEVIDVHPDQERTAVRFRLDANGNVVPGSVNRIFQPLRSAK